MEIQPAHVACVVGGGIAGSEAVARLVERKIHSVVFEMEALPYGKIELGLPKWHAKQRDQEEHKIDENLDSPYVQYVPSTQLGVDVSLEELRSWGFSVILLALGAWRDRPLAIPGIDEFQGRGFYYQNPFVAWFNRCHEPDFEGEPIELCDSAVVIGGGLASIDVVKILMLSLTQKALREKGLQVDLLTMEKKGIPRTLESLGISWEELRLKGCTLYYRRRAEDMPLVPMEGPSDPTKESRAKQVRQKVLDNARAKYLFNFKPCRLPVEFLAEGNRLTGLVFQKTSVLWIVFHVAVWQRTGEIKGQCTGYYFFFILFNGDEFVPVRWIIFRIILAVESQIFAAGLADQACADDQFITVE